MTPHAPQSGESLTPRQLEILQHALGLDQYGQGTMYRNHFVGEDPTCRELVALGLMREWPASELTGGSPLFTVTEAGKAAVLAQSPKPPKLTRGQQRYRKFLNWADAYGGSFKEFLEYEKHRKAHPEAYATE